MNEAEERFVAVANEALGQVDSEKLEEAVFNVSSFCFKETPPETESPPFSRDFMAELANVLTDRRFWSMEGSFHLLALFQNDWGRLDKEQRVELSRILESTYDKFRDSASQLVIVELLGEYMSDEPSLKALQRLSSTLNDVARAHVAHGFKCLAVSTGDSRLRAEALQRLKAMAGDSSQIVRQEVASAIADVS
jgi:hypothetical protein